MEINKQTLSEWSRALKTLSDFQELHADQEKQIAGLQERIAITKVHLANAEEAFRQLVEQTGKALNNGN